MTNLGRWILAAALASVCGLAGAANYPGVLCRKGGEAALADYHQTLDMFNRRRVAGEDDQVIRGLQRGVANECTAAARALADIRMRQEMALPADADPARRHALEAESLALVTETARVDDDWGVLGIFHMVRGSEYYDPQAAMKAFETGAAKGQRDCLEFVIKAYSGHYPDIAPDAAKEAFWRGKRDAPKQ